jgi:NAD+ synthase
MPQPFDPIALVIDDIAGFLRKTYDTQRKDAVIAVSGGIDSGLSLTLLRRALGTSRVTAVFLPYGDQDMADARLLCEWNELPASRRLELNIAPAADALIDLLDIAPNDKVRRGNVMARVRMIAVYDVAKKLDAMVCGTENRSEKHLGYFTRHGDAASDVEPINTLFKTDVRRLAEYLELPRRIIDKPPSAGLWGGQTDEDEMGFTYAEADKVLHLHLDKELAPEEIAAKGLSPDVVRRVLDRMDEQEFKHRVPYVFDPEA